MSTDARIANSSRGAGFWMAALILSTYLPTLLLFSICAATAHGYAHHLPADSDLPNLTRVLGLPAMGLTLPVHELDTAARPLMFYFFWGALLLPPLLILGISLRARDEAQQQMATFVGLGMYGVVALSLTLLLVTSLLLPFL